MILPITLTIAGAAAIVNLWLAIRIVVVRTRHKVLIGDGGNMLLSARMRAQLNFIEYTPLVLILMGLIEFARGTNNWLWGAGILYIIGRVLHPFGLDRQTPNALRAVGILTTWAVLLGLAIYALTIPYTARNGVITTVTSDSLGTAH
ncbi:MULTISPECIES: MAPEG family protein [unclassified Sphingomonas]|uniref:MAPEG family protein n=1 Tax=unclassified Sphingomonas TaxID=196159 RepID=UPI0006FB833D|nr:MULTISPECIES: MAPEG family protein [unclassified Sphingomonas]KQX17526.1 GST-like protein [Sphingomonas sp. Root1294]KQY70452.1 GST-like protein [Sphingomonas sp. Root50]KRB92061.1 GST-like protein [Sphingomonas sp. Root720]